MTTSQYMKIDIRYGVALEELTATANDLTKVCDTVSNIFDLQKIANTFHSTECLNVIHAITDYKLVGYSSEGFFSKALDRIVEFLKSLGHKLMEFFKWLGSRFRMLFHGGYDPKAFKPFTVSILKTYVDEELKKTFTDIENITKKYIDELRIDATGSSLTDFDKDIIERSLAELNKDITDRCDIVHFERFEDAIKAKKDIERRAKSMSIMRRKMESIQKAIMDSAKIVEKNMKHLLSKNTEANNNKITYKMNILSKACGEEVKAFTRYANTIVRCATSIHLHLKRK